MFNSSSKERGCSFPYTCFRIFFIKRVVFGAHHLNKFNPTCNCASHLSDRSDLALTMGLIFFHSLTITMTCRGTCSLYKNYPLLVSSGQSLVKLTFFSSRTQITCHSDKASFLTWFMNYGNMENHPPCLLYLFAPTDNGKNEMSIGQQWSEKIL